MARFLFKVELAGEGVTAVDAWAEACEAFSADPGDPHSTKVEDEELSSERAYFYGELRETFLGDSETTSRFIFSLPEGYDEDKMMDFFAWNERGGGIGSDGDYESDRSSVRSLGSRKIPSEHFEVLKLYLPNLTVDPVRA